jgi:FLYWCH zinc finger domain
MEADYLIETEPIVNELPIQLSVTQRGRTMLVYDGYQYVTNRQSANHIFWRCSRYTKFNCRATLVTGKTKPLVQFKQKQHTHDKENFTKSVLVGATDTVELFEILSNTAREKQRSINPDYIIS